MFSMRALLLTALLSFGCRGLRTTSDDHLYEWDVRGGFGYAKQLDEEENVFAAEVAVIPRIGLEEERRGIWTTTLMPEISWSGTFDQAAER